MSKRIPVIVLIILLHSIHGERQRSLRQNNQENELINFHGEGEDFSGFTWLRLDNIESKPNNNEERNLIEVKVIVGEMGTYDGLLGMCEGDCDGDASCAPGLKCLLRQGNEPVPGCKGLTDMRFGVDFCYKPENPTKFESTSALKKKKPLQVTATKTTEPVPRPEKAPTPAPVSTIRLSISDDPPFGQCEGDCRADSDCKRGHVCYFREGDGSVPGCLGTGFTGKNICIDPEDNPSGYNSDGPFRIKMFWKEGYKWQNESIERMWCMVCSGGKCEGGVRIKLDKCSGGDEKFVFINFSETHTQIQLHGTDYCLEVIPEKNKELRVEECDENNGNQFFGKGYGDFEGEKFELVANKVGGCITTRHHPKQEEVLFADKCSLPRTERTSYWVKY